MSEALGGHELSRRRFLGGVAVTGGVVLVGCGPDGPLAPPPRTPGPDGSLVALADVPVGGAVAVTMPEGDDILVAQPEEGQVVAFSSVCTHRGCAVRPGDGELKCPCHGSVFDLATGDNVQGPAPRPLDPVPVRVVDGQVRPG